MGCLQKVFRKSVGILLICLLVLLAGCGKSETEVSLKTLPHNGQVNLTLPKNQMIQEGQLQLLGNPPYQGAELEWYQDKTPVDLYGFSFDTAYCFTEGKLHELYYTAESKEAKQDADRLIQNFSDVYGPPDDNVDHQASWRVDFEDDVYTVMVVPNQNKKILQIQIVNDVLL